MNQQIIRNVPPFACVANKPQAVDAAPRIEEALVSRLMEAQWESKADSVHSELADTGNCLLRVAYEERYLRSPRMQVEMDEDKFQALLASGMEPSIAMFEATEQDEDGNHKMYLGWENVLVHAGVEFKVIPWEDMIILPALVREPEEAYGIGERLTIRGAELKRGVKDGKYIGEAVSQLLEYGPSEQPIDRYEKLDAQGIMPTGGAYGSGAGRDTDYEDYLCYELAYQLDANNDGEMEWVWITIAYHSNLIIRLQYIPYEHGRAPYKLFRYLLRPRELFGMGIPEMLASFQDAATAVLNQLVDHQDLVIATLGNFFYDGTSGFNPDKFELRLGRPIRVDSVEGIKPFDIQPLPAEAYQLYQLFKDICDLLTATSNPSLGKATDTQKTLGEVQIVAAASSMQFEEVASRVARDWADVWDMVRWLEAQYADKGEVQYRKTAAPNGVEFDTISREMLLQDVDLVPAGLKQLADMQSRVQQATIVQNTLLQHPLMQAVGPFAAQEIMVTLMDTFLQAVSFPQREKVMGMIRQALQANMAVMQAEMQNEAAMGGQPGMGGAPPMAALPPGQVDPQAAQTQGPVPATPPGMPAQGAL